MSEKEYLSKTYKIEATVTVTKVSALVTGVRTSKSVYQVGEPVTIIFQNGETTPLDVPSVVPWKIQTETGKDVYTPVVIQILPEPMQPGETRTWDWNQKDNQSNQVVRGRYKVVLAAGRKEYTADFEIK